MASLNDVVRCRSEEIRASSLLKQEALNGWQIRHARHVAPEQYEYTDDWANLDVNGMWATQGQTAFLRRTVTIPATWTGLRVGLDIMTGGEGLLTINGQPYHGVDDNRVYILLTPSAKGGETYECEIEMKTGNYFEFVVNDHTTPYILSRAHLVGLDRDIEEAYYDFRVVYDAAASETNPLLQEAIFLAARDALSIVDFRDKNNVVYKTGLAEARKKLSDNLAAIDFGHSLGKAHFAGHSHIDVAWLWPLKETARKVGRTYSTVTALMDEYPDYHFVCSQVPLFIYLKKYFPAVYEKVKAKIAEGRFEPIGGTWVENDTNVVSGESLVRQCLYGKRFFEQEFGLDIKVGWLPDVFGYSWALPQIYRKSGLDYFMTSKISWSDTNRFPQDTFWWEGIDGTRIFTHLIQGTYNHSVMPGDVRKQFDDYASKLSCPEFLISYGFGDGGGGPTRENLEYIPRMANIPGLPKASTGRTHDFFKRIYSEAKDLPAWNGELYLEYHRGTYTTQALSKKYNRQSELLYREAEMLASIGTLFGLDYPQADLVDGWQTILLNQFHDILPGSSINDVYVDSHEQYRQVLSVAREIKSSGLKTVADRADTSGEGAPVVVFNSLSWQRTGVVEAPLDGARFEVAPHQGGDYVAISPDGDTSDVQIADGKAVFTAEKVPACGFAVYRLVPLDGARFDPELDSGAPHQESAFQVDGEKIVTPLYEAALASDGTLTRLYDRASEREVIPAGERANVLQVFEDKPVANEAWDIDLEYQDKVWEFAAKSAPKVLENGPVRLVLGTSYTYGSSTLDQQVIFYADSPRIDFINHVDWQERKTMLKVAFPVEVRSPKATYEIAFGAIERPTHWNTSWDKARYEVSGHRWADLSESGYGVSILNDCKFGWDIKDNVIRLTLLKSPESPDPLADKGEHDFTYSLYPHVGDWTQGTVQAAQELNLPLDGILAKSHEGELGTARSFASVDQPNVIIDTLKKSEDGDDLIVRVYEAHGARCPVKLAFDRPIASAVECNLLEVGDGPIEFKGSEIRFSIKPFELRTFRVRLR